MSLALWLLTEEYADWRFVIAAKSLDSLTPFDQIKTAQDVLHKSLSIGHIPTLRVLKTQDAFARSLHKLFGKTKSSEGMRIEGQFIGNRFIEDAYVYRIR